MLAQVPLIVGSVVFFAVNLYLWSLPIRQEVLFLIATPIGIIYFAGFFWYVVRTATFTSRSFHRGKICRPSPPYFALRNAGFAATHTHTRLGLRTQLVRL
jgi:hypothetical protein